MAVRIKHEIEIDVVPCATCGTHFGLPAYLLQRRMEDGCAFYCPHGHSNSYHETELERLRKIAKQSESAVKSLDLEKRLRAAAEDHAQQEQRWRISAENSLRSTKGVVTRMKNRAANGVCPCCNRSFENLRKHMATKHPGFATTEAE